MALAVPTPAQRISSPAIVEAVALWRTESGAELEILATADLRWTMRYGDDGGVTIRLPNAVRGRELEDLSFDEGLVESITVRSAGNREESSLLVDIRPREPLRVSVLPAEGLLRVRIEPMPSDPVGQEKPASPVETAPVGEEEVRAPETTGRAASDLEERLASAQATIDELEFELGRVRDERDQLALGAQIYLVVETALPCLNVRTEPEGEIVDCLEPQTPMSSLLIEGDWAHVRLPDGREAWARSEYLEPSAASSPARLQLQLNQALADLDAAEGRNRELLERATTAETNLERAWEAQQNLSGQLVNAQGEQDRLQELQATIDGLESRLGEATGETERLQGQLESAADERNVLGAQLESARDALAMGGTTYVVQPQVDPCLVLRPEPAAEDRLDCLPPGTRGAVVDLLDRWAKLELADDRVGWVVMDYLTPSPATPDELRELEEARARIASLTEAADDSTDTLSSTRAELQSRDARIEELETENVALRDEVASANTALEELRNAATESAEEPPAAQADPEIAELEEKLHFSRIATGELRDELAQAQSAKAEVEALLADARQALVLGSSTYVVTADPCLNLRSAPEAEAVDCIGTGVHVNVIDVSPQWARVRLEDGTSGWASRSFLEPAAAKPAEIEALEAATAELADLRETTDARIASLEAELADARSEAERTRETVADLEAAQNQASEAMSKLAAGTATIATLTSDLEGARSSLATALEGHRGLEQELAAERQSLAELQESLDAVRSESSESDTALEAANRTIDELRAELDSSSKAQNDLETADATIDELQGELAAARETHDGLRAQLATEQQAAAEARESLEAARLESSDSAAALDEANQTIVALRDELDASRATQADLAAANASVTELRSELAETRETEDALGAASKRLASLEGELTAARESEEVLRQELTAERQALAELRGEVEAAIAAQGELDTAGEQALRDQLAAGQQALADLRAAHTELEGEIARSSNEEATAIEDLRERLRLRESELSAARETLRTARTAASDSEEALAAANRTIAELRQQGVPDRQLPAESVVEPTVAIRIDDPEETPAAEVSAPADADEIDTRLEMAARWARAWADQRVDDYLDCYATEFAPANGMDRAAWEVQRRDRLTRPSFIEVTLTELDARDGGTDKAWVEFVQTYRSESYSDTVRKTLVLTQEDGAWKILSETSVPMN